MKGSLFCALSLASTLVLRAADAPKGLPLGQLPPAVQATVKQQLAGGAPVDIEKNDEDEPVTYTVTKKAGKDERYFVVDETGKLTAQEISVEEAPPAVQKSLKACIGDGTLQGLEKTFEGNEINFDADFTKKDGAERSVTIAIDGRVASLEIGVVDLPPAVKASMEQHLHGGVVQAVYRNYESNVLSFQIEFDKGGSSREMLVGADGKMESVEVGLKDLPGPAQKTVREKVGNGRIVRIEKSFEKREGVEPFEIEAVKDGKPFNFSVGPKGRFLGMD